MARHPNGAADVEIETPGGLRLLRRIAIVGFKVLAAGFCLALVALAIVELHS